MPNFTVGHLSYILTLPHGSIIDYHLRYPEKARGNQPHQNNDSQMLTTLLAVQIILVQNNTKRTRK